MIKVLFAVGNALLTLGSVLALSRKVKHFGGRVKHHDKPKYTQPVKNSISPKHYVPNPPKPRIKSE